VKRIEIMQRRRRDLDASDGGGGASASGRGGGVDRDCGIDGYGDDGIDLFYLLCILLVMLRLLLVL
jgi:hypothetical protein